MRLVKYSLMLSLLVGLALLAGCPRPGADSDENTANETATESAEQSVDSAPARGLTASQEAELEGLIASARARYGHVPRGLKEAYRFAATHRSELEQIPCWCGCARSGHMHNRACFFNDDGSLDGHSVGCGVCVQTALMVKQGLAQGKSLKTIRNEVDARFSRVGPEPTPTPEIQG